MTLDLKGFIAKKECVQKGFMASNATRDVLAILPTLSGRYIILHTCAGAGQIKTLGKKSINYTYSLFLCSFNQEHRQFLWIATFDLNEPQVWNQKPQSSQLLSMYLLTI